MAIDEYFIFLYKSHVLGLYVPFISSDEVVATKAHTVCLGD